MRLRQILTVALLAGVLLVLPNCASAPSSRPPRVTIGVGVGFGHRGYGPGWHYSRRYRPQRPIGPPHRPQRPPLRPTQRGR